MKIKEICKLLNEYEKIFVDCEGTNSGIIQFLAFKDKRFKKEFEQLGYKLVD